jgi:hypothetical protein
MSSNKKQILVMISSIYWGIGEINNEKKYFSDKTEKILKICEKRAKYRESRTKIRETEQKRKSNKIINLI